jgi:hypothetical protein
MVVVVALVVAGLAFRQWYARINFAAISVLKWVWDVCLDEKTCRVAETFLNEAAVLWAVFPLLDSIYDPTRRGDPVLWESYIIAAVCFFGAVIISHARKEG